MREKEDTFNAWVLWRCKAKLFDSIHLEIRYPVVPTQPNSFGN